MRREQFTFYRSYYEALKSLPKRDQAAVLMAVIGYALDETEPVLSGVPLAVFTLIRPTLDSGRIKAQNRSNKTKTKQEQTDNKPISNEEQNGKEKEREKEGEKEGEVESERENDSSISPPTPSHEGGKRKRFVPPTLEDVAEYCRQRNSTVDPQRFFEYFSTPDSMGRTWIDSEGKPVRNWKQKLITWETKGNGQRRTPEPRRKSFAEIAAEMEGNA